MKKIVDSGWVDEQDRGLNLSLIQNNWLVIFLNFRIQAKKAPSISKSNLLTASQKNYKNVGKNSNWFHFYFGFFYIEDHENIWWEFTTFNNFIEFSKYFFGICNKNEAIWFVSCQMRLSKSCCHCLEEQSMYQISSQRGKHFLKENSILFLILWKRNN